LFYQVGLENCILERADVVAMKAIVIQA